MKRIPCDTNLKLCFYLLAAEICLGIGVVASIYFSFTTAEFAFYVGGGVSVLLTITSIWVVFFLLKIVDENNDDQVVTPIKCSRCGSSPESIYYSTVTDIGDYAHQTVAINCANHEECTMGVDVGYDSLRPPNKNLDHMIISMWNELNLNR